MLDPKWRRQYVGLPYENRGRTRYGVDCWGLVRLVYWEQLGIELPSYDDAYAALDAREREDLAALIQGEANDWQPVPAHAVCPYDCILLRIAGIAVHIGIVVDPPAMLHVKRDDLSHIDDYTSRAWRHRIAGFYRYAHV